MINQQRIETARAMLRGEALRLRQDVSPGARLVYVYGLMVCDDSGRMPKSAILPPWEPEAEAAARTLCAEFNLLGADN